MLYILVQTCILIQKPCSVIISTRIILNDQNSLSDLVDHFFIQNSLGMILSYDSYASRLSF